LQQLLLLLVVVVPVQALLTELQHWLQQNTNAVAPLRPMIKHSCIC
jgi:hypothetical protein